MFGFSFEALLLIFTIATGIIWFCDKRWWSKTRNAAYKAKTGKTELSREESEEITPWLIDYARSFFPILLAVFFIRSFIVEPFRIPSESMLPGLMAGDYILVNKYQYGVRLPVFRNKIIPLSEPERGDVLVFQYPVDPNDNFIKRVIGLPGDVISYEQGNLYINGELAPKEWLESITRFNQAGMFNEVELFAQQLGEHNFEIYERDGPGRSVPYFEVPEGHYFAMGDNRNDSDDSRVWGVVPEENIIGRAFFIWMSWDSDESWFRVNRIGKSII